MSVTKGTNTEAIALANELRPTLLQINRQLRRELAPLGITGGQATLLNIIRTHPGIGVREIAVQEGVSPPRITAALDRLEDAGLITRGRSATDRRRLDLKLTEKGARVLRSARRRRTAWLAARLAALDEEDRRALAFAAPSLRRLLEVTP